jgi:predicted TIM-barrel fold metal-dependent hydrolase
MRIDAHMHVNFRNFSADRLIEYLDRNKFDACWLLTWEEINPGEWYYKHLSIDDVYCAYLRYPDRFIPMYAPDPSRDDAEDIFLNWYNRGIVKGYGELKATLNWQSNRIRQVLSFISDLKVPLLFHMEQTSETFEPLEYDNTLNHYIIRTIRSNRLYRLPARLFHLAASFYGPLGQWRARRTTFVPGYMLDFASLEKSLQDFPKLNFVGHGPLFWEHFRCPMPDSIDTYCSVKNIKSEGITHRLLRRYPNLYADTSARSGFRGLTRDEELSRVFLSEFSHKIIFGTDNYMLDQEEFLKSLGLDSKTLQRICGENAAFLSLH